MSWIAIEAIGSIVLALLTVRERCSPPDSRGAWWAHEGSGPSRTFVRPPRTPVGSMRQASLESAEGRWRFLAASALARSGQLVSQQIHQQAVMEGAIGATLVAAHDADGPKADAGISADGVVVRGRRIDGQAMVATDVDEVARQRPKGVDTDALPLMRAVEEDVQPGMPVVGLLLLVELDRAHDEPVELDREAFS